MITLKIMCSMSVFPVCLQGTGQGLGLSQEKAMVTHSSTLAWRIPWMEEPGRLWSMGSQWIGHNWTTSLSLFTFMHWRRKWQPTPVFLPGESQGQGSLAGCRLWGRTRVRHDWIDLAAAAGLSHSPLWTQYLSLSLIHSGHSVNV